MTVDKTKEQDELPEEGDKSEEKPVLAAEPTPEDRARELELENARLKGRLEAQPAAPQGPSPDAWKQVVWGDINGLSDEDFAAKYKMPKHTASSKMLEEDFKASKAEQQQQMAELRAENALANKYPDYFSRAENVRDVLSDLSPEIRRDPAKLTKALERAYLADKAARPSAAPKKNETTSRRVIESPMEKPTAGKPTPGKTEDKDEIPEEYREICRAFGITSEKERKELMSSEYIPMELGGGVVFKDPAKGFEKVS